LAERNPARAGMVRRATDYRWPSAALHLAGEDESGMPDMEWRRRQPPVDWDQVLNAEGLDSGSARQKPRTSG